MGPVGGRIVPGGEQGHSTTIGELGGKVAIVTGAARRRGMGRAAADALAELGTDVVVLDIYRDPRTFPPDEMAVGWRGIDSTAERIRAVGRRALALEVDVTVPTQVQAMIDRTLEELGRVDILVNIAAYLKGPDRVPIVELDPGIFQEVIAVKVRGTFLCSQAVARVLLKQGHGGKIVTVSSGSGKTGSPHTLAYNAACFAQVGMTQSMARELGPHGINVNCVCPGAVDTARVDGMGRGERWRRVAESTALRRTGTADEVGRFIAYLCTEAASWIQGQSINIDGGYVMEH